MRPKEKLYDPANVSTNGIVSGATGATSPLTLASSGAGDGLAHQLNITSASNVSAITFTVTGTDADGQTQTEAVTGPNATTVESTSYFKTVTSITISGTLGAATVDIGWVDEFVTPTLALDTYANGASIDIDVTGTMNYTVQATNSDLRTRVDDGAFNWFDIDDPNIDLISITTDVAFGLSPLPRALRLKANSYTDTADISMRVIHNLGSPP